MYEKLDWEKGFDKGMMIGSLVGSALSRVVTVIDGLKAISECLNTEGANVTGTIIELGIFIEALELARNDLSDF